MARKKNTATEASATDAPQVAAETPQDNAAAETGKDTAPATETPQGQPVDAVEAVPEASATDAPEEPPTEPPQNQRPPDTDPEEPPEGFTPYPARVTSGLLVFRRQPDGEPVGTLRRGAEVRVVERAGEFARLDNGIFVKEAFLSPV